MKVTKSATEVDKEAGRRLRALRIDRGLSQTAVANHLGLTFQQVQKYEKGINRMGASRLAQLAELLNVQPADFFAGVKTNAEPVPSVHIRTNRERQLIGDFRKLTPAERSTILSLAARLAKK